MPSKYEILYIPAGPNKIFSTSFKIQEQLPLGNLTNG